MSGNVFFKKIILGIPYKYILYKYYSIYYVDVIYKIY